MREENDSTFNVPCNLLITSISCISISIKTTSFVNLYPVQSIYHVIVIVITAPSHNLVSTSLEPYDCYINPGTMKSSLIRSRPLLHNMTSPKPLPIFNSHIRSYSSYQPPTPPPKQVSPHVRFLPTTNGISHKPS